MKGASVAAPITNSEKHTFAIRQRLLQWMAPHFPLDVREAAILAYADHLRGTANTELEFYAVEQLSFGTGGMRGMIGYGPGRMNHWTVGRVSLALVHLLKKKYKHDAALVIAYDSRRMSREFAQTTAGVAASAKIRTYLFTEEAPTPILSYTVRKLRAQAGVVITASHNPPQYNGYKVYNAQGAQIVGREQSKLEAAIQDITNWDAIPILQVTDPIYKKYVHKIGADIRASYIQDMGDAPFVSPAHNPAKKGLKIIYTPLHGTGKAWLVPLLEHYGFQIEVVAEQAAPNGEFPTVTSPNPEEPDMLIAAENLARARQADIFLATDPDADRLGAGVRTAQQGNYTYLNGNQIGSIMCAFLCAQYDNMQNHTQKSSRMQKTPSAILYKTIVTTDLQRKIAQAHGVAIGEVLTGFKYIAEQIAILETKAKGTRMRYLFGSEESLGYLPIDFVRDKDGLAAALLLCEILTEVGDLYQYLDTIYMRYGLYAEELKSITLQGLDGQRQIRELMQRLRSEDFKAWNLGSRKVNAVLDYQQQTKNGKADRKTFKDLPRSNVIQFVLQPEGKLTIRPSGTEPKVKLYASLHYNKAIQSEKKLEHAKRELHDEIASILGQFIAHTGI